MTAQSDVAQRAHFETIARNRALRALDYWWILASSAIWFVCSIARPLYEPDEGRYAEIPREMLVSGDWIVPHLNGYIYIEKPPFQYWITALAYSLFGVHEWTARLATTLTGWGTLVLVSIFISRRRGIDAAFKTWLIGASSLIWILVAHQLTLDTLLTFFMTVALLAYCESQHPQVRGTVSLNFSMWIALGCAVLTKGFVAIALPAAAFAVYCMWQRDWRRWHTLHVVRGMLILAAVIGPWMLAIQSRLPDFFDFFVVREHFLRYLTPIAERNEPWWFFVPILIVGTLPWTPSLLGSVCVGWRTLTPSGKFSERRLLWTSAMLILAFFSISHSKLVPYILPMVPIIWILACVRDDDPWQRVVPSAALSLGLASIGAIAIAWSEIKPSSSTSIVTSIEPELIAIIATLLVGALVALGLRRSAPKLSFIALGSAWILAATMLEVGPPRVDEVYSAKALARVLQKRSAGNAPVFSIDTYDQTLTFYLGHTVRLVRYRGELEFGIEHSPQNFIPTLEEFVRVWNQSSNAIAVMPERTYQELLERQLSMHVIAHTRNYVAASRKPA